MKRKRFILNVFLFLAVSSFGLDAQIIRIRRINLRYFPRIQLMVSIEDSLGHPLPVDSRQLQLSEENRPVTDLVVTPQHSEQAPIYTVIVLDKSGSMRGEAIENARQGAAEYVSMMCGADQTAVVLFDTRVELASPFSSAKGKLADLLKAIPTGSDTALLDALSQGVELARTVPEGAARVVLALTDGRENRSRHNLDEVIAAARSAGVSMYAIGLGASCDSEMLKRIAAETESNYYAVSLPTELTGVYHRISQLLHSQLEIIFTSPLPMDKLWHVLKLEIPLLNKTITGERKYLSAKESSLSTEMLKKLAAAENPHLAQTAGVESGVVLPAIPVRADQQDTILLLAGTLAFLLVLLLAVLILKKNKKTG